MNEFRDKYGYGNINDSLFKKNEYTISNEEGNKNVLKQILDEYNGSDRKLLQQVSSMYNKDDLAESKNKIKEYLVEKDANNYKNWNGTNQSPTLNQIRNYKEYSEFKSSKFKVYKDSEYENGQIKNMYFKFDE